MLTDFLEQGKVRSRHQRTEFFEYHRRDLQQKVNDSVTTHFQDMDRRLKELAASNLSPAIKLRQQRMFEQRMDEYDGTVTLLMQRFASIPSEGV